MENEEKLDESMKEVPATIPSNDLLDTYDPIKSYANYNLVLQWREWYLSKKHSMSSTTTYFNYINLFVGKGIIINQKTTDKFHDVHPSGVVSGALKNFFSYLVKRKGFSDELYHIHFDSVKKVKKKPQILTMDEVNKIIEYMGQKIGFKEKVLTILLAGLALRIDEGLTLEFNNFDWDIWLKDRTKQGHVTLENTKGGKYRTIPVNPIIMELLYSDNVSIKNSQGIPIGGYVNLVIDFGLKNYVGETFKKEDLKEEEEKEEEDQELEEFKIKKTKKRKLQEAYYLYLTHTSDKYRRNLNKAMDEITKGQKKIHPHSFRHYRAQCLLDKGLPLIYLQKYLGHSDISSTSVYIEASDDKLSEQIEEIDRK